MLKVVENGRGREAGEQLFELDEIARMGARRMLMVALATEAADYVERHRDERDDEGRALGLRDSQAGRTRSPLRASAASARISVATDRRGERRRPPAARPHRGRSLPPGRSAPALARAGTGARHPLIYIPMTNEAGLLREARPQFDWFGAAKLLRGLRLPSAGAPLLSRGRTVALLEAGAASGVASLVERRREVIAAAISTDQLLHFGRRTR